MGEREQLMVERAVGSVHVVGDPRTPLSWAGTRPAECIGFPPHAFTSTARPLVRPVHLEAGPVVGPQNHEPASTSWLDFGRCTTRAFLGSFVSTVDPLVRVSFCWAYHLSDPQDCGFESDVAFQVTGRRRISPHQIVETRMTDPCACPGPLSRLEVILDGAACAGRGLRTA
jgi:hypothetical protein